jgi:putative oxidoreductase
MERKMAFAQLFLRLALGITYLVPGLDRLGVWGPPGGKQVSWGDWSHFTAYAHQVMFFLPYGLAEVLAIIATVCELIFGVLLLAGCCTRWVAIGSGLLLLFFALSMAVAFGITSPLNYSVFTASAASFLLATIPAYAWSIDAGRTTRHKN